MTSQEIHPPFTPSAGGKKNHDCDRGGSHLASCCRFGHKETPTGQMLDVQLTPHSFLALI